MDHSGHIWVTAFNDVGEQLLGKTANELIELKVSCVWDRFEEIVRVQMTFFAVHARTWTKLPSLLRSPRLKRGRLPSAVQLDKIPSM
jgi:hypothetical protein